MTRESRPTPPAEIDAIYALSPLQHGLLFHALYAPDDDVYLQQVRFTVPGDLDVAAFRQAWEQVVLRHAVLRTFFLWENRDTPLQIVPRRVELPWEERDWRAMSDAERDAAWGTFLDDDRRRGLDISRAPLLRFTLVRVAEDAYEFLWTYHHLLLDGWSTFLVLKDVCAIYDPLCRGEELPRLPTPRPYADFIVWLQSRDRARAKAFWSESLSGFTAATRLRVPAPDEATGTPAGHGKERIWLGAGLGAALQDFLRRQHVTFSTVVQGAWAVVLSRYSGTDDVLFGTTVAGRPPELSGVDSMVGLFINTVSFRLRVPSGTSVADWLAAVQTQHAATREYEHTPLVDVQSWSDVPGGQALFDTLLTVENYPVDAVVRDETRALSFRNTRAVGWTNYPITVLAVPGSEPWIQINYTRHRFDVATVRRMLNHFRTVLAAFVAGPHEPVGAVSLLTPAERHEALVVRNRTARPVTTARIHEQFEAQAARSPDAVAVRSGDAAITYDGLNRRANQFAHCLMARGVTPGALVGVCMERSVNAIVAILATLKAGATYVPFDAGSPRGALRALIAETAVSVLVTEARWLDELRAAAVDVLCVDQAAVDHPGGTGNPRVPLDAGAVAYVFHTSGSTGQPKRIVGTHRSAVNYLAYLQRTFDLAGDDVVLQVAPLTFDASIRDILGPLVAGARLVILPESEARDPSALLAAVVEHRATCLLAIVPSRLAMLVAAASSDGPAVPDSVRLMLVSGEVLPLALCRAARQTFGSRVSIVNQYGPTECTMTSTYGHVSPSANGTVARIGRPIPNARVYVLDLWHQPLPLGVEGELYIGGVGVALGYLGRPDLTASAFLPDPFADEPGTRLYRTGDFCRDTADGELEFVGRSDHQVKLRGVRIELGAVEMALRDHAAVQDAVVVVREEDDGDQRLVAYAVPNGASPLESAELRRFLAERLPEPFVPSAIVMLEAFPLTPHGKVDRAALPSPRSARPTRDVAVQPPRNAAEATLVRMWAEVLGVDDVGIHESFFDLGGHSLLATLLISRIRRALGIKVPLRSLFRAPTVAGFAAALDVAFPPPREEIEL